MLTSLFSRNNEDHLHLYAQPIVDLGSMETVGHEILANPSWFSGDRGKLISAWEKNDPRRMVSFDLSVIESVCALLAAQSDSRNTFHTVNVSLVTLQELSVADTLAGACRHYEIDPQRLAVEITETGPIKPASLWLFRQNVEQMAARGHGLWLDDVPDGPNLQTCFGITKDYLTGIKLQGAVVERLRRGGDVSAFHSELPRILDTVQSAGKKVLVEGVQEAGDHEIAAGLGTLGQGFGLGRPQRVGLAVAL